MTAARDRSPSGMALSIWDRVVFALIEFWIGLAFGKQVGYLRKRMSERGVTKLTLANPRYLNEKYFWRRIFDRDPRFTLLCDKIAVRDFLSDLAVEAKLPRILWTGTDPDQIPERLLAADVIVKAAHGWNQSIVLREAGLEPAEIRAKCCEFLSMTHGVRHHEWGYFNAPHRIIIEERLFPHRPFCDLKYTTYGSVLVQLIAIYPGVEGRTAAIWLVDETGDWHVQDQASSVSQVVDARPLPPTVKAAAAISVRIGAAFDHMRVDFMTDGHELYLGELTVYNAAGSSPTFGHLIETPNNVHWDLRRSWFLTAKQRGWKGIYAASLRRSIDWQAAADPRLGLAGRLDPAMLDLGLGKRATE